jgi:hypothetical protein
MEKHEPSRSGYLGAGELCRDGGFCAVCNQRELGARDHAWDHIGLLAPVAETAKRRRRE